MLFRSHATRPLVAAARAAVDDHARRSTTVRHHGAYLCSGRALRRDEPCLACSRFLDSRSGDLAASIDWLAFDIDVDIAIHIFDQQPVIAVSRSHRLVRQSQACWLATAQSFGAGASWHSSPARCG